MCHETYMATQVLLTPPAAATWEVMREPMILLSVQAMLGQQASEA